MNHRSLTLIFALIAIAVAPSRTLAAENPPSKREVLKAMTLANRYFLAKWPVTGGKDILLKKRPTNIWTRGVYFEGALALYRINRDPAIERYALEWATFHRWKLRHGDKTPNPDDQCAGQAYTELYQLAPAREKLAHLRGI